MPKMQFDAVKHKYTIKNYTKMKWNMRKIYFQPIYNRKKKLNSQGKALLQIEAYLERRKIYFSTHIYLSPEQWDNRRKLIRKHPNAEALNYQIKEFLIQLESK